MSDLYLDILNHIFELADYSTQLALCQTCKAMRSHVCFYENVRYGLNVVMFMCSLEHESHIYKVSLKFCDYDVDYTMWEILFQCISNEVNFKWSFSGDIDFIDWVEFDTEEDYVEFETRDVYTKEVIRTDTFLKAPFEIALNRVMTRAIELNV